jgi:hypothetical protein
MTLQLLPLGRLSIEVDSQIRMPSGPLGERVVGTASKCRLDGERIHAHESQSPGTDWLLVGSNGIGVVNARILLETDEGAKIAMKYSGRLTYTRGGGARVITAPTFETNDEQYSWLNAIQAVGQGERTGSHLVYELFEVAVR